MQDNISKIKDKIDVVDLVGEYVKLQKAGLNFRAPCPFHNEKTPSFYVSPERQIWHCFGCSRGGSIFDFIMESESVDFGEALKILARKAGIEIETYNKEFQDEKAKLIDINQRASKFFEKQLWESNKGKQALEYLRSRSVKEDTIKKFRLGFAPDSWDSLLNYLKDSGHDVEDISKAGLVLKKENKTSYYDRFRSRITFPISDYNSQVVGFTGRIFPPKDDETAKYINTPQTSVYDKSRILYGLDLAKSDIRKKGRCLVVEGNMDVIMSHQAGASNCVASSGTALTNSQVGLIKRFTRNVDFSFDTDDAGGSATDRGVAVALGNEMNVGIVSIPDSECKDPADYVALHGDKWLDISSEGKPIMEFYFQQAFDKYNPSQVEDKKAISARLLPFIKSINNSVEKTHWVNEIANGLMVSEKDIRTEMEKVRAASEGFYLRNEELKDFERSPKFLEKADRNILEDYILSLILWRPLWYKDNYNKIDESMFSNVAHSVLQKLRHYEPNKFNLTDFMKDFSEDFSKKIEIWYLQSQAQWADISDSEFETEFTKLIHYLKKSHVKAKLAILEQKIRFAEREGDDNKITNLVKQFTELSKTV